MCSKIALMTIVLFLCSSTFYAQRCETEKELRDEFVLRQIVPFTKYVNILPIEGGASEKSAVALDKAELSRLVIGFQRNNLSFENGPQFIKVTTTFTTRNGEVYDQIVQYAFTFAKEATPDSDDIRMREYAQQILPFGFISRRKIDSMDIHIDSLVDWAVIKINVTPDEDFTKYSRRLATQRTWYYRAKGKRWDTAFYLGIPKVLYDSNNSDTVNYGNASAMLRLFLLDGETGSRYPVNIGVGTFGVSTPLDVSKNGGGFVISLFFDIFQFVATNFDVNLGSHFNGGLEVTPFFPINHNARLLVNARVGISP